ncbi:hypothetical protein Poly51_62870 [Rubripirellula tenax]|uniref:Uncharacterized protein n=1 Tax=Rubripirellula tenax TaxID=2528015 RepID=A0A5C6E3Z8_9BACT|nr:hypothetical protein [Rubripirellula tenax]TWU43632.1 hypothetical protein Poly51_62870 [Rubripirellula tenax]
MGEITWDGVGNSLIATLIATAIIFSVGRLAPYVWSLVSDRARPFIWNSGFSFVRRFYVNSFISAIKRQAEIRSRIRFSILGLLAVTTCVVLSIIMVTILINVAVYLETVRDVAVLIETAFGDPETAEPAIEKMVENWTELLSFFEFLDSPYAFYIFLGVLSSFVFIGAFSHITQQFRASLEVELKRLNEYMKLLASKQELTDLAILECNAVDGPTAGEYIAKINDIAQRHGIREFDRNFPIVNFLRRLEVRAIGAEPAG